MEGESFVANEKSQLRRIKERGSFDHEAVKAALQSGLIAHVGVIRTTKDGETYPVVIPMLYGYDEKLEYIYLHGSGSMGMSKNLGKICVSVATINGFVIAKSLFHHSANYESVVIHGNCR
jgi:nitroimidazol reductase NimA-like FMN-containing flavoprotein (pyridoxamine 5'-phosphate oxidase superfamily)